MSARRIALLLAGFTLSCAPAFSQVPSDTEIRKILADRVGAENNGTGIVVGVVDANGRRIVAYGSLAKNDNRKLDGNTVFEIGSMTKVFTSLVLMDMVRRGEVALTDPISKYLPETVKAPERNGRRITLADLSTQSSGLPRLPTNLTPKDANNPYADYTVQQMYDFLSGYKLTRDIGAEYEYSNLGVGLLGHVLTLRAGMNYEALVRSRVCDPLGLKDTRVTLTPEMKARLAIRHNGGLAPVANLGYPDAGGRRRAALDRERYAHVPRGQSRFRQNAAARRTWRTKFPCGDPPAHPTWKSRTPGTFRPRTAIPSSGITAAPAAIVRTWATIPRRAWVSSCSQTSTPAGRGRHRQAPAERELSAAESRSAGRTPADYPGYEDLRPLVGQYQLGPNAIMTMSRDGDRFYTQLTGQPKFEVFAESERELFLKVRRCAAHLRCGRAGRGDPGDPSSERKRHCREPNERRRHPARR